MRISEAKGHQVKYLGLIKPRFERWIWPFKQMQPGDFFTVLHADRDPEEVRALASVRAAQTRKRFSVNKDYRPGMTCVTCLPRESLADIMS